MAQKRKNFMKIVLIMVSSVNGKITNAGDSDITSWTSEEDKKLFYDVKNSYNLIVMGSHTYEAGRKRMQLNPNILRIVLTKKTNSYAKETVPGQLEFTSETPGTLVTRLTGLGYKKLLLVGGGQINSAFFKEKLIDELHLTVEPTIFGSGKNLLSEINLHINLKLLSAQKLNRRGTLLLTYQVV
jgi:dihydrofolate reductase